MKLKTIGSLFVICGICMILCAGGLTGYNLYETHRAEQLAAKTMTELTKILPEQITPAEVFTPEYVASIDVDEPTVEVPPFVINPSIEMPESVINGKAYIGTLEIPVLELELPVISDWSRSNAKIAPCRYQGSAYQDNLIVCAHNYKSHFGKIPNLVIGDVLHFTDMEGNLFTYEVVEMEILDGTAIEQMVSGNWDLTLFTCTVGGKARFTVRCEKMNTVTS